MWKTARSVAWIAGTLLASVVLTIGIHYLSSGLRVHSSAKSSISIVSEGSDYDIWRYIAKSNDAKKAGLKITVKEITDGVQMNKATSQGTVDANAFQSWTYLGAYNKQNPKGKLTAVGTTYLEPMGIYSKKYSNVKDIPEGATIALANDAADESRGLLLLQEAKLIKLKKNFSALSGVSDIVSNPKQFKFKTIDDHTGPRILNQIDAVLISNTIALEGGLHVLTDSIYHEKVDQSTKNNVNVIATSAKNKNSKSIKKLVKLYHQKDIQKYIKQKYYGTKIEVQKPISYLN